MLELFVGREFAASDGHPVTLVELSCHLAFSDVLRRQLRCPGPTNPTAETILPIFQQLGQDARKVQRVWVILADEIQWLRKEDRQQLVDALREAKLRQLPIVFVGAGLPSADAETQQNADFIQYRRIGNLTPTAVEQAVRIPFEKARVSVDAEVTDTVAGQTGGYPFFVQLWAYHLWNAVSGDRVTVATLQQAAGSIRQDVEAFFQFRLARMTPQETALAERWAANGDGPYAPIIDRAAEQSAVSSLCDKGMVVRSVSGKFEFTVPGFADYLRRRR